MSLGCCSCMVYIAGGVVCCVGLACWKCLLEPSFYLKFEYVSFPIGMSMSAFCYR